MNLNLLFSALMVLLMMLNLEAEWIMYLACTVRVKLIPDVRSKRNPPSPCPGQVTRAGSQPPQLLQVLTYFFYNIFLLHPWSCLCFLPLSSSCCTWEKVDGAFQAAFCRFHAWEYSEAMEKSVPVTKRVSSGVLL